MESTNITRNYVPSWGSGGLVQILVPSIIFGFCAAPVAADEYRCSKRVTAAERRSGESGPNHVFVQANSTQEARAAAAEQLGEGFIGCIESSRFSGRPGVPPQAAAPASTPARPDTAATNPRNAVKGNPFANLTMGDYLDAIYNGDTAEVRRLDERYAGKLRDQMRAAKQDKVVGQLMTSVDPNKITLAVPMMRTYTHGYGDLYASCLRSDAVSFTMHTTVRNSRYGTTELDTVYRMNKEFANAFKDFADEGERINWAAGDMLTGRPISRTIMATTSLMQQFKCDDAVIRRFEANLIEIYWAVSK